MAPPNSYGFVPSPNHTPSWKTPPPYRDHIETSTGLPDDILAFFVNEFRLSWHFARCSVALVRGRPSPPPPSVKDGQRRLPLLILLAQYIMWHLRRNMVPRRLFSVPHLLVAFWVVLLLWGERWTFHAQVSQCQWESWEKWPSGATPHHLVFVADPQIIDAHSYPGRPWPVNDLTMLITDNYMRRSFLELQEQLRPDSVFFLGDLFDGGREWRTDKGKFEDPAWSNRPDDEKVYAEEWQNKLGEDYWMREYARFGDIFFDPWKRAGSDPNPGQRGRRLVASLPGNHDLGFGSQVKLSVRNRFQSFFGDTNRVDVIGNHTIVSVDTVSLSADSSQQATDASVEAIFHPTQMFLHNIAWEKQKAVARELRLQRGEGEGLAFPHTVETTTEAEYDIGGIRDTVGGISDSGVPPTDLPTILLTHVPLYRPPGTPCGPKREHWPPSKPPTDDDKLTAPDDRNAISISGGYQYQNVLSETDSVLLIRSIGNVVHAFSGDDHDYCELVHNERQDMVPEITVKAFSMAMGVPTPGFLMVSLYNPIDELGHSIPPSTKAAKSGKPPKVADENPTVQTHLCLLPNQLSTFARYGGMIAVSLVLLAARAMLVPILGLQPFALDPASYSANGSAGGSAGSPLLPVYKDKVEDDEYYGANRGGSSSNNGGGGGGGGSGSSGFFRSQVSYSRGRNQSNWEMPTDPATEKTYHPHQHQHPEHPQHPHQARHKNRSMLKGGGDGGSSSGRPGSAYGGKSLSPADAYEMRGGPKIQIIRDEDEDDDDSYDDFEDDDYYGSSAVNNVSLRGNGSRSSWRSGRGGDRWQPAARRGVLGLSMSALSILRRALWSVLRLRFGGRRYRRRRAGLGLMRSSSSRSSSRAGRNRHQPGEGGPSLQRRVCVSGRELWTSAWRVTWMVVLYWAWLNYKG